MNLKICRSEKFNSKIELILCGAWDMSTLILSSLTLSPSQLMGGGLPPCVSSYSLTGVAAALGVDGVCICKHGDLKNMVCICFLLTELNVSPRQNPGRLEGNSITDIWKTIYSPFGAQKPWRLTWSQGACLLDSAVLTADILKCDCVSSLGRAQASSNSCFLFYCKLLSQRIIISKVFLNKHFSLCSTGRPGEWMSDGSQVRSLPGW